MRMIDVYSAASGDVPLRNFPFDGFLITVSGVERVYTSSAMQAAENYPAMLLAIQEMLAADPLSAGKISASLGESYEQLTPSGTFVTGREIVLTSTAGALNVGFFLFSGGALPAIDYHSYMIRGGGCMDPFAGNLVDQLVQPMAAIGHWMLGFAEVASTDLDMNMTARNASFEWDLGPAAPFVSPTAI